MVPALEQIRLYCQHKVDSSSHTDFFIEKYGIMDTHVEGYLRKHITGSYSLNIFTRIPDPKQGPKKFSGRQTPNHEKTKLTHFSSTVC
jgi:hypothetical protein